MNLEAFILGTGGMMPLPGRNLTSLMLRREGDLFLFDCGEATQVSLRRLNLRWKKISAIFISHTHADHVTGLPGILMLSSQVDRSEPLYIYGPPKIREYVEVNRKALEMYVNYEIIVKEMPEVGIVHEERDFYVESFPLYHTRQCVGYSYIEHERAGVFNPDAAEKLKVPKGPLWAKLQAGEDVHNSDGIQVSSQQVMGAARKGRKVSFVTDTMYKEDISSHVANADLFVCEGMFKDALSDSAKEKKHLTAVQAAKIARDAGGIASMGLIHFSPRYTNKDLNDLLIEAKNVFPETFLCRDRMKIDLPFVD